MRSDSGEQSQNTESAEDGDGFRLDFAVILGILALFVFFHLVDYFL